MSSNNNPPRPREWTLYRQVSDLSDYEDQVAVSDKHIHQLKDGEDEVTVIERAAYEQVCKERDELRAELDFCNDVSESMNYASQVKEQLKTLTEGLRDIGKGPTIPLTADMNSKLAIAEYAAKWAQDVARAALAKAGVE